MSSLINTIITVLYYLISAFFLFAVLRNFVKTRKLQEAVLYAIIMIPFILRIVRLK